jgi:hypothetical protein
MEKLLPQLALFRQALEGFWRQWAEEKNRPNAASGATMCRYSAAFVSDLLGWGWRVKGGAPHHDGDSAGFFDGSAWHPHHWVSDGYWIVDLTADQFGADKIIVTTVSDPRYRPNYTQEELEEAMSHVEDRVEAWVDSYIAEHPPAAT